MINVRKKRNLQKKKKVLEFGSINIKVFPDFFLFFLQLISKKLVNTCKITLVSG